MILILVMLALGVVAMVAGSLCLRAQRSLQAGTRQETALGAEDAAFSGLQTGLAAIIVNGDSWTGDPAAVALPHRDHLSFRSTVNSNFTGTTLKLDTDGTEIPPEAVYIKSFGYVDGNLTSGYAALAAQQRGIAFNYPAFGSDRLLLDHTLVEAVDVDGNSVDKEAPVRTNSTGSAGIELVGGSYVDGSITVGQGGDAAVVIQADPSSGFSGDPEVAGSDLVLPSMSASYTGATVAPLVIDIPLPVPIPGVGVFYVNETIIVCSPGNYDHLVLGPGSGAGSPSLLDVTMASFAPGDYFIKRLTVSGNQVVVTSFGTTRLQVRDEVDGSALWMAVMGGDAGEFQIHATEPSGTVSLTNLEGNLIITSQGSIDLAGCNITGAVYGRNVEIRNSVLSFPKVLDGKLLNDSIQGDWRLFGIRAMDPAELQASAP